MGGGKGEPDPPRDCVGLCLLLSLLGAMWGSFLAFFLSSFPLLFCFFWYLLSPPRGRWGKETGEPRHDGRAPYGFAEVSRTGTDCGHVEAGKPSRGHGPLRLHAAV